jgi:hypothetical protein
MLRDGLQNRNSLTGVPNRLGTTALVPHAITIFAMWAVESDRRRNNSPLAVTGPSQRRDRQTNPARRHDGSPISLTTHDAVSGDKRGSSNHGTLHAPDSRIRFSVFFAVIDAAIPESAAVSPRGKADYERRDTTTNRA